MGNSHATIESVKEEKERANQEEDNVISRLTSTEVISSSTTSSRGPPTSISVHSNEYNIDQPVIYESKPLSEDVEIIEHDRGLKERMASLLSIDTNKSDERAPILESIYWLGRHVPHCVLEHISHEAKDPYSVSDWQTPNNEQELRRNLTKAVSLKSLQSSKMSNGDDSQRRLPHKKGYKAALLFIDMSGFTKISQDLDVESLSKAINSYFQAICNEVILHKGDILKFAGDAIFAEWRIQDHLDFERCVNIAATCGAEIVAKCSDYPIYNEQLVGSNRNVTDAVATLNVHCGLGVGEMYGVHVGNEYRREYLVLGDTIDQVAESCDLAELGELRASVEAQAYLNLDGIKEPKETKDTSSIVIARAAETFFQKIGNSSMMSFAKTISSASLVTDNILSIVEKEDIEYLHRFQSLLCQYIHPVVLTDGHRKLMSSSNHESRYKQPSTRDMMLGMEKEKFRSEAELRSVVTIFIMPKIDARLSHDEKRNNQTIELLNKIMNTVTATLDYYKGHLRQYIVDDKGVVLIGTFGLRGSTYPDMISERVLPTCKIIHESLANDLGIDSKLGATSGRAYCGVVGSVERHEYAVLGPSVNLAARLMAHKKNHSLLVDDEIRHKARQFNFIAFPPVKAKGYSNLVPVFQPLTAKEARWGREDPDFVGRKKELSKIEQITIDVAEGKCESGITFMYGVSGSGKTSLMVKAIARCRKKLMLRKKSSIVTRNISCDGDKLEPFSLFRSIFRDLLSEGSKGEESERGSIGTDSVQEKLSGSISLIDSQRASIFERLQELCIQLNAPEGFVEIVGHHLLGSSKLRMKAVKKAPKLSEIISFMAQVFLLSSEHVDVIILALDDVQYMDNLSWKVIERIFEQGKNLSIICGSRPLDEIPLTVDEDFWTKLHGIHKKAGQFHEINVEPLSKADVRLFASSLFKTEPADIDDSFIEDIYANSRGIALFTSMILKNCIQNNLYGTTNENKVGWNTSLYDNIRFADTDEIFLQQIDKLDEMTRKVLQIACVIGTSFEVDEIVGISTRLMSIGNDEKEQHISEVMHALEQAVEYGIFEELVDNNISDHDDKLEDETEEVGKVFYSFQHSSWKRLIQSIILDSFKHDINKYAAFAIEVMYPNQSMRNYRIKLKLFRHWKEAEEKVSAASVALNVGKSFKILGLNEQGIEVYNDALDIWRKYECAEGESRVSGFAPKVLESLDEQALKLVIQLLICNGQAHGSAGPSQKTNDLNKLQFSYAKNAFEDALSILKRAPVSSEIEQRSFIFPIYSGMSMVLKYGNVVAPSEQLSYEKQLADSFVLEAKRNGDPVHYSRALAMKSETLHREEKFQEAMEVHLELKKIYDPRKHSATISELYASDRCAQDFSFHAICCVHLNRHEEAMHHINEIIDSLLPCMDLKNVHNSMCILYPIIWILRMNKQHKRVHDLLFKYAFEPFDQYYGKDGFTPMKPTFKGLKVLLDIDLYLEGNLDKIDDEYYTWAMYMKNLVLNDQVEASCANFGRGPMTTHAEICLKLSSLESNVQKRRLLLRNASQLAYRSMEVVEGKDGSDRLYSAFCEIKPIYNKLKDFIDTDEYDDGLDKQDKKASTSLICDCFCYRRYCRGLK